MLLYDLLQVKQAATQTEIRKAYLVLARKLHPDKQQQPNNNQEDHNKAFIQLKRAYDILSNEQSRARYDLTGSVEEYETESFQQAYERFRGVRVTEEDIARAQDEYRESAEEARDLDSFFEERLGDVRLVLAYLVASREEDVPRFVRHWEQGLKAKRLSGKFAKEFARAKKEIVLDLDDEEEEEELDGEEEEDDGMSAEEEEDDGFFAADSEEEEEQEEEEVPLQFGPGDDVQLLLVQGDGWVDAHVLSAKRGVYDVELAKASGKRCGLAPSSVRARPASTKRIKNSSSTDDGVDPALAAMLLGRAQSRQTNLVAQLEAKYANKKTKH